MAEFTEIIDTDQDGVADRYNNLASDFGISGNYHETNAICTDGEGGFYIALGTASHNGPTFFTPRGEYSKEGRRGRNFSSNDLRGWVVRYHKDGSSPRLPAVSVCTMESPVLLTVKFGVETIRGLAWRVSDLSCKAGVFQWTSFEPRGTQTSMVSVLLSSSQERCWMIFITSRCTTPPHHHEFLWGTLYYRK